MGRPTGAGGRKDSVPVPDGATGRPYRLLFVSHSADLTGAPRCLLRLLAGLDKARFAASVVVPEKGPLLDRFPPGTPIHLLGRGDRPHIGFRTLKNLGWAGRLKFAIAQAGYMRQIYRLARASDLVHVNTSLEGFAALAVRLAGRPLAWHIHEPFPAGGGRRWRWFARFVLALSSRVVFVSEASRRDFLSLAGGRGAAKCRVIYNGLDPAAFRPNRSRSEVRAGWGVSERTPVLLVLGTVNRRKGQLVFLEALERLVQARPDLDFRAVFAGEVTEPAYAAQVEAAAGKSLIKDQLIWLGQRDDPADLLNAAGILVVPSLADPFPWVVLEAMALAKPVIASRVDGLPEMVAEGETGLLVPPGRPEELALALARLLDAPDLALELGRQGYRRVTDRFTEARYLAGFEKLYLDCLVEKKDPSRNGSTG